MSEALAYPGNRFVAASWRPGADAATLERLRAATSGWTVAEGPGWLLACEKAEAFGRADEVALALGRARMFDRANAAYCDATAVARAVAREGAAALSGMGAPFRCAWARAGGVQAVTDVFGLGQVFLAATAGFAAAASSATLLADIVGARPSQETLAAFGMFGGYLGAETPFEGVSKLAAGARAELTDGRLTTAPYATLPAPDATVAEAFAAAVRAMLKAVPDAELELSGGLDSRLILAAMPRDARTGRRTMTVGVTGEASDDVDVARVIAAAEGLDWTLVDAGGLAGLSADELEALLRHAVAGYDHMANPLDKAALILSGRGRSVEARFGGQNGEILRGFYYVGQPLDALPTEALARRLVTWRLEANDKVEDQILSPAMKGELRAAAEARMVRFLLSFEGTWGQALDQFYLAQRMQNWVGNACGARVVEYHPLFPFFDSAFVAAAMARPPVDKLNSRAAYEMLCALDPSLARRPLADGVTPASQTQTGLARKLSDLSVDAQRLVKRLRRRLAGVTRPTLGSQTVSQHWRRLALHEHLPVERLAATGLFDEAALGRVATGEWLPDRPTLGFLLAVAGLETRA